MTRRILWWLCGLLFLVGLTTRVVEWVTESWWFHSLGYDAVYKTIMLTRAVAFVVGATISGGLVWLNVTVARRIAQDRQASLILEHAAQKSSRPLPLDDNLHLDRLRGWGMVGGIVGFTVLSGLLTAQQWALWQRFLHAVPLGTKDPILHRDLGFYLFQLPALNFAWTFIYITSLVALLLAAGIYAYEEAIELNPKRIHLTEPALRHLSILGMFLLLWKALGYQLSPYNLLTSQNSAFFGAGYTDVNWRLPLQVVMTLVAVTAGVLLGWWGWRGEARRAGAVPLLYMLSSFLIGTGLPALIERTTVSPDAQRLQSSYLQQHINWTRQAYNLEQVAAFSPPNSEVTLPGLRALHSVAEGLPAWPASTMRRVLDQQVTKSGAESRDQIADVDTDYYSIDGELRPVMIAAGALPAQQLSNLRWAERHLEQIQGEGLLICDAYRTDAQGQPIFYLSGADSRGTPSTPLSNRPSQFRLQQPAINYGEFKVEPANPTSWSLWEQPAGNNGWINSSRTLNDTNQATGTSGWPLPDGAPAYVLSSRDGTGGIPVGSRWRQWLLGWRFLSPQLSFNWAIKRDSRLLWHRGVLDRCQQVAPFLSFEGSDPYPVLTANGGITWIVDAFVLSNAYPYAEPLNRANGLNYIRNIAKVTVDALNGEVNFYTTDDTEPFTRVYQRLFPGLLKPLSAMPADLRQHLHYPPWLLEVQAAIWRRYHNASVQQFGAQSNWWAPALVINQEVNRRTIPQTLPAQYALLARAESQNSSHLNRHLYTIKGFTAFETAREVITLLEKGETPTSSEINALLLGTVETNASGQNASPRLRLYNWQPTVPCAAPNLAPINIDKKANFTRANATPTTGSGATTALTLAPAGSSLVYVKGIAQEATNQSVNQPPGSVAPAKTTTQSTTRLKTALNKNYYIAQGRNLGSGDTLKAAYEGLSIVVELQPASPPTKQPSGARMIPSTEKGSPWREGLLAAKQLAEARQQLQAMQRARARGDWAAYGAAEKELVKILNTPAR